MKYKHKRNHDGYFKESWLTDEILPSGNKRRVVVRDKDYKTFVQKLEDAKRLYKKGITLDDITVTEWGERWLAVYKAKVTDERKAHFRAKLALDIIPEIGHMRMRDVRASHLQDLLNGTPGKKSTVSKVRIALRQIFDAAETEGIIEKNPSLKLRLPEGLEESPRRPLTEKECHVVWDVAQFHSAGVYVITMLFCGLRRGECVGLTLDSIDFTQQRIDVKKAITYTTNQGTEKNPKSEAGIRQVPLPNILLPFLKKHCEGKKPDSYLFTKIDGSRATETTVRRWWDSFLRQCHISAGAEMYRNKVIVETSPFSDEISPHFLRHTYATDIHAAGVHDRELKYFIGHRSNDVTDRYRGVSDDSFNRAAELINCFLDKKYGIAETESSL